MAPERLAFLDGLRGVAACWVVCFHLGAGGQIVGLLALLPRWLDTVLIDWGYFGVAVFFVLSGFVIARSIGDISVDGRFLGRFALRRSIRLDLPYWASIAFTLAVLTVKGTLRPGTATPTLNLGNLLAHLFYLQDLLGFPEISEVYWTLCFEIQFYLLFCALLYVAARLAHGIARSRAHGTVFTLAALLSLAWPLLPALHLRGLALPYWHAFLLGVFITWTLSRRMDARWLAAYAAGLTLMWSSTREPFTLACLGAGAVIYGVGVAGRLGTLLNGRAIQFLGRISYSLYLLHIPVSGATFALMSMTLGDSLPHRAMALVAVLMANLVVAWTAWRFIERPSTALARRFRLEAPTGA